MSRLISYKYRIYPNVSQKTMLSKTFGCVRYFWNKQVEIYNSYDKETNPNPIFITSTNFRNQEDIKWMLDVSASPIQQKENDFKQFKKQKFNKNRKVQLGRPQFKKRSNRQSFRLPNQKFVVDGNRIRLEKIGWIEMVMDRELPTECKFMSVTVSKNPSNQYFVSILVDKEIELLPKTGKDVGIDMGLKEFMTQSDGIVVGNPRFLRKSQAKLKKLQQFHSRKKIGSVRRGKSRLKLARAYQKVTNQRDWFIHNETARLIKKYDNIYIEDLNVSGMMKKCKPKQDEDGKFLPNGQSAKSGLNKSLSDVSFSKFFNTLQYKADWYGKNVQKIGRFEPSSKTCSNCGNIKKDLTLKDRVYKCEKCGTELNRDLNASINIKAMGVNIAIRTQSEGLKT